jgi:RNA polymerase sigma factor (sigma-70 family)
MPLPKSSYDDDMGLARACLEGKNESVKEVQSLYNQRLTGLLVSRGATSTEAADILGDFWGESLVPHGEREPLLSKYHGKCSLYTWLATVVTHRLVDLKRRQRFQGNLPSASHESEELVGDFDQLAGRSESLSESVLTQLMREALRKALQECSSEAYVLLQLVYIHGVLQREAAKVFGWHESKVSRTLEQAMADIASRTMRYIKQSDPWLDVTWDDFMELCQSTGDIFASDRARWKEETPKVTK